MANKRVKKYTTGEASKYISRRAALRMLQVSLREFRRLCILKGIYPREPKNRKKAQKGDTGIKTLYLLKDIQFLKHEPIIWQLRDIKTNSRKIAKAKALKDYEKIHKFNNTYPTLPLDHIVKERYPTFIDAIRDLDDCLTLCYMFSTFPSMPHVPRDQSALCRRLTMEFMHYVIEAKALRKVFVSIKGYYFQAEIKGQDVTWIVPHHFSFEPQSRAEVDFKLMSTFVEFYLVLLGFVNFRLYHTLNLYYPPKFSSGVQNNVEKQLVDEEAFVAERVSALNCKIAKLCDEDNDEVELDNFNNEDNQERIEEMRKEAESLKTLKTLFKGLKIFLNREVPREPLVFMIRCFGGEVSWDKLHFVGATFDENDETITHQIVDRPSIDKQHISRYYVQPQWIFDSINNRTLMPVNKYFMGETLPPHLSPFTNKGYDDIYMPPEERAKYDTSILEKLHNEDIEDNSSSSEEENDNEKEVKVDIPENNEENEDDSIPKKRKLTVKAGQRYEEDPLQKKKEERQEYRLREKMVKNKHKRLYKSMMEGRQKRKQEIWLLRKKRRLHDAAALADKKAAKKNGKNGA